MPKLKYIYKAFYGCIKHQYMSCLLLWVHKQQYVPYYLLTMGA